MDEPVLINLAPEAVERAFVRRSALDKLRFAANGLLHPPRVRGGSWDRRTIPVHDHPTARLMTGLVVNDFEPERCFEVLLDYYRGKGRSESVAAEKARERLHDYVGEYRALFQSMRDQGYRPDRAADAIGIAIDRKGGIVKVPNGQHRFYAARLLGLPAVPAEVRFVHSQWYRRCPAARGVAARIRAGVEAEGMTVLAAS